VRKRLVRPGAARPGDISAIGKTSVNLDPRTAPSERSDTPHWPLEGDAATAEFPAGTLPGAFAKRALDVCFSIAVFPFALFAGLPIALLVMLDGGQPVFRHERIGRNGTPFHCYKFRTMVVDADDRLRALLEQNPAAHREWRERFKLESDPRVTPLGWLLRKTSLDELPQIWNVIKGDMSWVGPRPIVREELPRYGMHLPAYLACRPGITGLWQVNGRSDTTYGERIAFDVDYAQRASVWLDLKILALTIPRVLTAKGSL
jgi:lipopolysaccharide/colanic/teichoic acid biosynthesis glycosyltransferase